MVNLNQAWAENYRTVRPEVSVQVAGGGSVVGIAGLIERSAADAIRDQGFAHLVERFLQPHDDDVVASAGDLDLGRRVLVGIEVETAEVLTGQHEVLVGVRRGEEPSQLLAAERTHGITFFELGQGPVSKQAGACAGYPVGRALEERQNRGAGSAIERRRVTGSEVRRKAPTSRARANDPTCCAHDAAT